jgi:hypothetical protein
VDESLIFLACNVLVFLMYATLTGIIVLQTAATCLGVWLMIRGWLGYPAAQ